MCEILIRREELSIRAQKIKNKNMQHKAGCGWVGSAKPGLAKRRETDQREDNKNGFKQDTWRNDGNGSERGRRLSAVVVIQVVVALSALVVSGPGDGGGWSTVQVVVMASSTLVVNPPGGNGQRRSSSSSHSGGGGDRVVDVGGQSSKWWLWLWCLTLVSGGRGRHPGRSHGRVVDASGRGSWVIPAVVVIASSTLVVSHPGGGSWIVQAVVVVFV